MLEQQHTPPIHFRRSRRSRARALFHIALLYAICGLWNTSLLGCSPQEASNAETLSVLPYASLHHAVAARDLYAVLDYIEAGEALDGLDETRLTPYLLAVQEGAPHIAMALQRAGASRRALAPGGNNAAHLAAAANRVYTLDTLSQWGIAPVWQRNREAYYPAHTAAALGNTDISRVLTQHGQRPDVQLKSAVYSAPLLLAAENKHWDTVAYLRIAGADYGMEYAIYYDDFRTIRSLLAFNPGALEQGNMNDLRPLHVAISFGRIQVFKLFLEYGADIDSRTYNGKDALDFALEFNRPEIVDLLIAKGASPNALCSMRTGRRRLHRAAQEAPAAMVALLIKHGAQVDTFDADKHTALFLAVENNRPEVVRVLLAAGALVTPEILGLAREKEYAGIIPILENAGKGL